MLIRSSARHGQLKRWLAEPHRSWKPPRITTLGSVTFEFGTALTNETNMEAGCDESRFVGPTQGEAHQ